MLDLGRNAHLIDRGRIFPDSAVDCAPEVFINLEWLHETGLRSRIRLCQGRFGIQMGPKMICLESPL